MRKLGILTIVALTLLLQGCDFIRKHPKEDVVAECYGKYLYKSELDAIIPEGTSMIDSIQRVGAFIDTWIRRQVLLHQAENNLGDLDFSKELEEYRNSLVVYTFESQLIDQRLDTIVTDEEMETFYEEHKDDFQVRTTMVKAAYVIIDEDCKQRDLFAKLLRDKDTLMLQNLDELSNHYAVSSYLDIDHWMRLSELTAIVPVEILNTESFLKRNKFVSMQWNNYICMVRFVDYLLEESVSPFDLERQNIKSVILERRKKELLDRMKNALYEKAKKDKAFEVYVGSPVLDSAE